jgi:hypothetical protein
VEWTLATLVAQGLSDLLWARKEDARLCA